VTRALSVRRMLALGISGAKVGSWNTKSLTLWGDCQYEVNPDTPESHGLMGWWRQEGSQMQHQHT
jgi:replication factor A1